MAGTKCDRPFLVGPQQASSCPVSFELIERDRVRFRSKGQFYSLIRDWRGESSRSRVHALPDRPWSGLLYRVLLAGVGGGAELSRVGHWRRHRYAAGAPGRGAGTGAGTGVGVGGAGSVSAHAGRHLELRCRAQRFCPRSTNEVSAKPFVVGNSGLKGRARPLHAAACEQVRLDQAQRKRKNKRLDFITWILFLFPRNCWWALPVTKEPEVRGSLPAPSGQLWLHLCLLLIVNLKIIIMFPYLSPLEWESIEMMCINEF